MVKTTVTVLNCVSGPEIVSIVAVAVDLRSTKKLENVNKTNNFCCILYVIVRMLTLGIEYVLRKKFSIGLACSVFTCRSNIKSVMYGPYWTTWVESSELIKPFSLDEDNLVQVSFRSNTGS